MTVATSSNRADFTGNGSTTVFPYTFRIFAATDLVVTQADASGTETQLVLDTDYTVTGAGSYNGGNVTLTTALPSGYSLTVVRELDLTQETDLRNQGAFFAETHEDVFDRLTMVTQQLQEQIDRSAKLPITNTTDTGDLVDDLIRLADSADNIDTVANDIANVNIAAGNIDAINDASNQATAAASSASAAATSESNAAASASTASTQATNAANSATAAAASASAASTSASNASSSASAASTSASNASSSASAASSSASAASTSASNAASSASAASTSASNAATSETNAGNSATAAAGSATAAAASYDSFDDRYLGAKSSNPATDNDGDALIAGALYFNTTVGEMRVYDGTNWLAATVSPDTVSEAEFTATAGQTSYTFTAGYRIGFVYVWVNGVMLADADYTATDGSEITFASALALNDEVRVITFKAIGSITIGDVSGLQAELDQAGGYSSKTISVDTTLDANTEYQTGKNLQVNSSVTLSIPATSLLHVRNFATGAFL